MVTTHTPPKDLEVTLLALGIGYGLYGDRSGNVGRICDNCLTGVNTLAPRRVYLDDSTPEGITVFNRYEDTRVGVAVYAAFDPFCQTWLVREVFDVKTGAGTGRFFLSGAELVGIGLAVDVC